MPAAIDKEIVLAIVASPEPFSKIYSLNYQEFLEVDLSDPSPMRTPAWANYLLGVARQMIDKGAALNQIHCVFGGNIPAGSGLSSSAAVEGAFAFALNQLNNQGISAIELARIGQWSEHHFVGVQCGIMDQFANMMGKANHVIHLDCRSMEYEYLPFQFSDYTIILVNSGVKHTLASSEYNVRRGECEEGVRILKKIYPGISSLRDVNQLMLEKHRTLFSEKIYNRCRYVVDEMQRVQFAGTDLRQRNLLSFGKRMVETHRGLSNLYEVSCPELDFLVSIVQNNPSVAGARMMGGGFGGCTINIIQNHAVDSITDFISRQYKKQFKNDVEIYRVHLANGTGLID